MEHHGEGDDPTNFTTSLKGSTNSDTIKKAVNPDAGGPPSSGLARVVVMRGVILCFAVMGRMLKKIETQKAEAACKEEMMVMKACVGRLQQLQRIGDDIHQSASD
jgi:hypothetical protein